MPNLSEGWTSCLSLPGIQGNDFAGTLVPHPKRWRMPSLPSTRTLVGILRGGETVQMWHQAQFTIVQPFCHTPTLGTNAYLYLNRHDQRINALLIP